MDQNLKTKLLSLVEVHFVEGKLEVDIDLDGAVGILFEDLIEPKANDLVANSSNTIDDSVVALLMPLLKKEAMEYAAELEEKLEAKIDDWTGNDSEQSEG